MASNQLDEDLLSDGDYLSEYRRFLEHFVTNVCARDDQLPVKMGRRDVRQCELIGEITDIVLQHLNQRMCPPSLQAFLVKLVIDEFKLMFQKQPEDCGFRAPDRSFSPLKLMQTVTNKVNEICQRYLDNSRLALLPPPPSTPLPLASSYEIKNKRRKMEDRSVVLYDLHTMYNIKNDAVVNYYAVFDGHGGQEAATYCAAHLHQYLIESSYYLVDQELALRDAFKTTDYHFIECDDTNNSGATAVCALLYDKTLYIAWAGDSQAALIKNGRGINLTIPHKPERPDEKLRIEKLGGEVIFYGSWRVNGILSVSRSIGDAKYKPYISHEPEIKRIELDGTEDFLVVACDGFWERATEDIVASLLYEYVCSSNCDHSSASKALVNWAKQNLSEDNISVIVVFLSSPAEIAAKSFFEARPIQYSSMESGLQQPEHQSAAKFEPGLAKQHLVNSDADAMIESVSGLLRPKPPKYIDGGDENGDEDDDLGPETNVDDAFDDFSKPDHLASYDTLVKQLCESPIDADYNYLSSDKLKSKIQNELISGTDNVGDSEDSEDEWNFYRPVKQNIQLQLYSRANSAILENPVQSNEEVKLYNPKPDEENLDLDNRPSHHARSDHSEVEVEIDAVAGIDADEIIANSVEFHELNVTEEQKSYLKLKKNNIEDKSSIAGEDFPVDKEPYREQQIQLIVEENKEEDMESHLNPNAAEFVPTSNAAPGLPQLMDQISGDLLAGSPLKQSQRALKNRQIPSEEEFQKEICRRPSEIDDSVCSDYSNDGPSTQEDPVKSDVDVTKQKTLIDLDQSEMSSTKAEFGDESNFSMVSEFYKTGLSTVDCSYTDSDRTDLEFSVSNAMATSMTPNDFKSAFEQEPDLNQVHELSDEDFMTDTHNGSLELENKNDVKNIIIANELLKENVEFDLHDFAPQQEQNAEMFSALAERRKSDNKNLFRNIHNIEHDSFSKNEDVPNSPTNNASSADCAPFPESQDIANELNKVKLQSTGINLSLDEPNETLQFMQNPSDLNVRPTSAEPISNDLVFMAPIKETEAMLSKFAEENLLYHKLDRRVECNEVQDLTSTNISFKNNTNINLSESLQEFTGLEDQLSPQQFGMNTGAPHILKEKFVYEQKDVEETTPSSVTETGADENSLFTNEPGKLSFNDHKDSEPKAVVPVVDTVVTNNAMSAASATALATVKPVKHMKAATKTTKPTGSTNKLGFKTTTHISPIKSNTIAKTGGVTGSVTKKSTQSVTSKTKLTNVTVGKAAVSASTKSTSNKSTIGLKNQVSSSVTAKASSYTSTLSSAPKPKFVSTSASKLDSTSSEKIQTMANGDLKPASKVVLAPKTTSKPASSITITGLVNKTRTSLKTSSGPAVPSLAAAKPKPVSAKTLSCRLSSANAHSSTNSIALSTRPKTALTFTTNLTLKSKLSAGATTLKSPVIDKQIKETANKQISSVRNTSLAQKMRQSTANPTMNTSAKRVSLTPRAKTDANTASPTKKPAPISKLTSKMSSATAKLYSKTSITKDSSVTSKPESNSNSEHEQPKLNTNTTMNIVTTNIEQDTPTKDISPVEPPTDNQLITAE